MNHRPLQMMITLFAAALLTGLLAALPAPIRPPDAAPSSGTLLPDASSAAPTVDRPERTQAHRQRTMPYFSFGGLLAHLES